MISEKRIEALEQVAKASKTYREAKTKYQSSVEILNQAYMTPEGANDELEDAVTDAYCDLMNANETFFAALDELEELS